MNHTEIKIYDLDLETIHLLSQGIKERKLYFNESGTGHALATRLSSLGVNLGKITIFANNEVILHNKPQKLEK